MRIYVYTCRCVYVITVEIVTTVKGRHKDTDALRPEEAVLYGALFL